MIAIVNLIGFHLIHQETAGIAVSELFVDDLHKKTVNAAIC